VGVRLGRNQRTVQLLQLLTSVHLGRMPVCHIAPPEGDTTMSPTIWEEAARQAQLEFSQRYSKGELEGMGSHELLEASSRGMNSITGLLDDYVTLDGAVSRSASTTRSS
jgi:hypothetical protein